MRLWETGSWRQLAEDKDYGGEESFGAAFGPNGALYTVAVGGAIRRYGADGALETKATTHGGTEPYSIAVHPDGMKLAVGFNDTAAVEVYDARTLQWLYAASASGIGGDHRVAVAWSADGARLYGGGNHTKVSLKLLHAAGKSDGPISTTVNLARGGAGPPQRSTAIRKYHYAAATLRRRDGGGNRRSRVRDGSSRWHETRLAGQRHRRCSGRGREAFAPPSTEASVRLGLRPFGKRPVLFDLACVRSSRRAASRARPRGAENKRHRRQGLGE